MPVRGNAALDQHQQASKRPTAQGLLLVHADLDAVDELGVGPKPGAVADLQEHNLDTEPGTLRIPHPRPAH